MSQVHFEYPKPTLWLLLLLWPGCWGTVLAENPEKLTVVRPGYPMISANQDSSAGAITPDGRVVVFTSAASNLVPGDENRALDVFWRDLPAQRTLLVSVAANGHRSGNGPSSLPGISTNGQWVVFASLAGNLVDKATNSISNIFLRDMENGVTRLVSTGVNGLGGNADSRFPSITPDARFVVFASLASNLAAQDSNHVSDVFVRDINSESTTLVSVNTNGVSSGNGASASPVITPDGRHVVFKSAATDLTPNLATNYGSELFLQDTVAQTTRWISEGLTNFIPAANQPQAYAPAISTNGQVVVFKVSGAPGTLDYRAVIVWKDLARNVTAVVAANAPSTQTGDPDSYGPVLSADGRWVAYVDKPPGTNTLAPSQVYVWDAQTGLNNLASASPDGVEPANGLCDAVAMTPDGAYLAFLSAASNLVAEQLPPVFHIYRRDLAAGRTRLVSERLFDPANQAADSSPPCLTPNGRWVLFDTADPAFVGNDDNRAGDVFVRDLQNQVTELVSPHDPQMASITTTGSELLYPASVSANGLLVAYASGAPNWELNDNNAFPDVYVWDVLRQTNILVSADAANAASGNDFSTAPSISADGRWVAFQSLATNLVPNDTNGVMDIFARDLHSGTTWLISRPVGPEASANGPSDNPVISPNGRYIVYRSLATNLVNDVTGFAGYRLGSYYLYLWDFILQTNIFLSKDGAGKLIPPVDALASISGDSQWLTFASSLYSSPRLQLQRLEPPYAATNFPNFTASSFSGNGRWLAVAGKFSPANGSNALYALDLAAGTNWLATVPETVRSLSINNDGRFIVFEQLTSQAASNGFSQIYRFDRDTGVSQLLSLNWQHNAPAQGASKRPVIGADGAFILFRSSAEDLVAEDGNRLTDIFQCFLPTGLILPVTAIPLGSATGNSFSFNPVLSADNRTLVFSSFASDLLAYDYNDNPDRFVLRLEAAPADSDNDQLPDAWELQYFGNLSPEAMSDFDGDGLNNLAEYWAGTNPTDPQDVLRLEALSIAPGDNESGRTVSIFWKSVPGKTYRLQYKNDGFDTAWTDLPGEVVAQGTVSSKADDTAKPPQRYYRVLLKY